jgi:hypothetical protein
MRDRAPDLHRSLKQPDRLVFEYTQMMLGALFLKAEPHSILIIGLGGGTLPRTLEKLLPGRRHRCGRDRSGGGRRRAAVLRVPAG